MCDGRSGFGPPVFVTRYELHSIGQQHDGFTTRELLHPSDILLNILTRPMAESYGLPAGRMGFVPGIGHDRHEAYVFYHHAEELVQQDMQARQEQVLKGISGRHAKITQVLGR